MEDLKIYTIHELSDLKKGTSEGVKRGWEKRRLRSKYDSQRNQMSPEEMKIPLDPPCLPAGRLLQRGIITPPFGLRPSLRLRRASGSERAVSLRAGFRLGEHSSSERGLYEPEADPEGKGR